MAKRTRFVHPNEPLFHPDHPRPVSRRELISQGFRAGTASVLGMSAFSMLGMSRAEALDENLKTYFNLGSCDLGVASGSKVPFICFDLAGGANIAGSNVLIGGPGGQRDSLDTAGYARQGLPPDILPDLPNAGTVSGDFSDSTLGLQFHSESALLAGIMSRLSPATAANVNGAVIPARSDNDTGNNPHNPMYGIYQAGLRGQVLQLIGSSASVSGGNSMAPAMMIDPELRPTKIDRPADARGLVDVGELRNLLTDVNDIVSVMETVKRISDYKMNLVNTTITNPTNQDRLLKERLSCEYLRAADTFERYPNASSVDPSQDASIVGPAGIFAAGSAPGAWDDPSNRREYQKTASVMKVVLDGLAGAGTVTMGGYDYHTGDRNTGEARDFRAGECIGACIEYASRLPTPKPVMIYVFSDGSVFSNGMEEMIGGVPKGVWTGDNSSTAASFFLVYDPNGRPQLMDTNPADPLQHQQIGWMRPDGSVETSATPAANNVNMLVQTVILNYMALHGESDAAFTSLFGNSLGNATERLRYVAFQQLASVNSSGFL